MNVSQLKLRSEKFNDDDADDDDDDDDDDDNDDDDDDDDNNNNNNSVFRGSALSVEGITTLKFPRLCLFVLLVKCMLEAK